ncbi:MAG TPA: NAD-dependent epimerase/dehydratase family protein [Minicystis sp.]|nr:NAD-dependent epimerase/dehydratase family protein [Minicystis sp.]
MAGDLAAVSGATGFIGSAVVRRLVAEGRPVRALVEPGAPLANLEGLPVEVVTVDVCDREGMERALGGAAAFYHLAAIYKVWLPNPETIYRVNVEGTTNALLAAMHAGVRKVVYTASIAAVGLRDDGSPSDETDAFNLYDIANEYLLTKHLSERIALRFASSLPVVVVNPAFPFGPGDVAPTPTGGILLALLRGQVPGVGEGGFCAIDVDDVAAGHVAAEARGRVGERYILGDHNVTFREFFQLVGEVAGIKPPTMPIPSGLARGIALGMELWADHVSQKEPRATYKAMQYMQRKAFFDVSKARRELGLPSRPLAESIERAVRWFRETGKA